MIDFVKNLDFERIKERFKPLGIAALCFVAVFIAGFGAGRSGGGTSSPTKRSSNSNYTTNSNAQAKIQSNNTNATPTNTAAANSTVTNTNTGECKIKGSKSKIYHVPGGSFYTRTNAAQCFSTEEEAQGAGYTKSSR